MNSNEGDMGSVIHRAVVHRAATVLGDALSRAVLNLKSVNFKATEEWRLAMVADVELALAAQRVALHPDTVTTHDVERVLHLQTPK